jgi:mono/diheme cytochrome c family protein
MTCACSGACAADDDAALRERGKMLFTGGATPACAICHTLEDAGATGAVGPSLDDLKPDAARVEAVLRKGMGAMPAYTTLSDEEVKALSVYVERATHGR